MSRVAQVRSGAEDAGVDAAVAVEIAEEGKVSGRAEGLLPADAAVVRGVAEELAGAEDAGIGASIELFITSFSQRLAATLAVIGEINRLEALEILSR